MALCGRDGLSEVIVVGDVTGGSTEDVLRERPVRFICGRLDS